MNMSAPSDNPNEFYIVDFDRTLVDSDKLTEIFVEVAEQHQTISREQVMKADADMKQLGDSLDTAGYVRDHLMDKGRLDIWDELEKQFIHESRSLNYMLPGAVELLEWLAAHGKRYGILTYGNPLWQRMKLTAAGFNHVRHIIMEHKEKGKLVSSWQRPDGTFKLPEALGRGDADAIIMIDDKAISFSEFPGAPSHGFWVLNPAHELPSQQGTVPENVERYPDLLAVIDSLSS